MMEPKTEPPAASTTTLAVATETAAEGANVGEGSARKAPQKRRKKTVSPTVAPAAAHGGQGTPLAKSKTSEQTEEMNGKLATPQQDVPASGELARERASEPAAPSRKRQKSKHLASGGETAPAAAADSPKKQKKPAKHVRFHIKLYPSKSQLPATSAANVAKKRKAKQQSKLGAEADQQNGGEPKKGSSKKSRSKAPAKLAEATAGPLSPPANGGAGEYVLPPPPSSSFTPLKRVQIKQELMTPQGKLVHANTTAVPATATPPPLPPGMPNELDSVTIGRQTFGWLIGGGSSSGGGTITVEEFMGSYWERKPLLVQRNNPQYYAGLLSRAMIDEMLRTNNVEYTKNIDITSYVGGQRETHNPDGRVLPPDMWHFYGEGCSVRMLNPQTYLRTIYELNVKLQEYFHCMTGANFYLTPPNSQGFAPHYDDIEAFVLQIEGRKRWRLYPPRHRREVLARVSSENLPEKGLPAPMLDVVLEAGDLLYFPRGCIHQAATVPGAHSLHVTLSVYQRNSWADLFEQMLPLALAGAAEEQQQLREGLPLDLHHHFGIVHSDVLTSERRRLTVRIRAMFDQLFSDAAIDAAVDQLAKRFQHDALPPMVDYTEWNDTVYGAGNYEFRADGTVQCARPIEEQSSVRLLRRNILRLVSEERKLRIYYHTDNSREYHQYEANFLELDHETALGVELLIKMYPRYIPVASLPVEDRLEFIRSLWEKGLIVCRRPGATDATSTTPSLP